MSTGAATVQASVGKRKLRTHRKKRLVRYRSSNRTGGNPLKPPSRIRLQALFARLTVPVIERCEPMGPLS